MTTFTGIVLYEDGKEVRKMPIIKDIAQYEENDSILAKHTIIDLHNEIERLNNIINELEKYFEFLKMNSTGGNKEFMEDILDYIKALKELKGSDKE